MGKIVNHVLEPVMTGERRKNWGVSVCLLHSVKIRTRKRARGMFAFCIQIFEGLDGEARNALMRELWCLDLNVECG